MPARRNWTDIVGHDYETLKSVLLGYKKNRETIGWDHYANKMNEDIRNTISAILAECRRQGFLNPRVQNDQIVFDYVCYNPDAKGKTLDQCTLCERECNLRDNTGVLIGIPCWGVRT